MFKLSRVISLGIILIFGSIGYNFLPDLFIYLLPQFAWLQTPLFSIVIGILVGAVVSLFASKPIEQAFYRMQDYVSTLNASYLLFGTGGAILGLVIAWLVSMPLIAFGWPLVSDVLPIMLTFIAAYIGFLGWFLKARRNSSFIYGA